VKLCYCDFVKNLTVSIPDEVYRVARVRAAEGGSSVSALVADYLSSLGGDEAEFSRLEAQQEDVLGGIERFRAGDRLTRDELHRRAIR
jgi:plasmid stability protein